MNSSAKWIEEYGEEAPKKSNNRGKAVVTITLSQVASEYEMISFEERDGKDNDFWGQPRLIAQSVYPRLGYVNPARIPEQMILGQEY